MKVRFLALSAIVLLSSAAAATAGEDGGPPPVSVSTLARAEVRADLEMWRQAGLPLVGGGDSFDVTDQDRFGPQLAEYDRLRSGPEYLAEVQRQEQGAAPQRLARAGSPTREN